MNFIHFFSFIAIFTIFSCSQKIKKNNSDSQIKESLKTQNSTGKDSIINDTQEKLTVKAKNENSANLRIGFDKLIDIQELDPSILIDLKYASEDNFMKKRLYFDIDRVYLQKDVAERLVKVQHYLKQLHPELTLLVYDGVRPLSVQKMMWDALDSIPVIDRVKFVSNPASGSIHNYGAAVDLTISNKNGIVLDMGAGYDDIREIAYPKMEKYFLEKGMLTINQIDNRKLLRKVMSSQNFYNISTEWWHFNACTREQAKNKYEILK